MVIMKGLIGPIRSRKIYRQMIQKYGFNFFGHLGPGKFEVYFPVPKKQGSW